MSDKAPCTNLDDLLCRLQLPEAARPHMTEALTHRSYVHEHPDAGTDNQRLEFLGDAVLNLVVTRELFCSGGQMSEGEMSRARAALVCERSLHRAALTLGLDKLIRLGKGEEACGGRSRPSILADAMEAVIGAAFVYDGLETAARLVNVLLGPLILQAVSGSLPSDPKSALQHLVQREPGTKIGYAVESEQGPDHDKEFVVNVLINGLVVGRGQGKSKRQAEQAAAAQALDMLDRRSSEVSQ